MAFVERNDVSSCYGKYACAHIRTWRPLVEGA
jgi:hypothetical protein